MKYGKIGFIQILVWSEYSMRKIIKNSIKCNHCGDIIVSEYRHNFKWCSCQSVAVDGGTDYLKRSFKNSPADFTELSECEEVEDK